MRNASPYERRWTVCKKGDKVLRNHPVFVLVCEPMAIVHCLWEHDLGWLLWLWRIEIQKHPCVLTILSSWEVWWPNEFFSLLIFRFKKWWPLLCDPLVDKRISAPGEVNGSWSLNTRIFFGIERPPRFTPKIQWNLKMQLQKSFEVLDDDEWLSWMMGVIDSVSSWW